MTIKQLNSNKIEQDCYVSPEAKVIIVNARGILCSSIDDLTKLEDDSDKWS